MIIDNNGPSIFEKIKRKDDLKNIILALESVDQITGANFFNGSSTSYYLKELGKFNPPMNVIPEQWYSIINNKNEIVNKVKKYQNYFKYENLDNIEKNEKYIYHIDVTYPRYFLYNKNLGFSVVNSRVLDDVNCNNAAIVITQIYEGFSGAVWPGENDFEILNDWIDRSNLNPKNVWYLTGNLLAYEKFKSIYPYNIVSLTSQEMWNNPFEYANNSLKFEPSDEKYLFLNFNRAPRDHRFLLLVELMHHELFTSGHISFNYTDQDISRLNNVIKNYNSSYENYASEIFKIKKQFVDSDNTNNLVHSVSLNYMKKTFVSLITETQVNKNTLQLTEKIWKPIMSGHPFLLLSSNGSLKLLKNLGFKTYSEWFDESYDDADFKTKLNILCSNLLRYKNKNIEELKKIRVDMSSIASYNQKRLLEFIKEKYFSSNDNDINCYHDKIVLDWIYTIYNTLKVQSC